MSSEPVQIDKSLLESLKQRREELIKQKSSLFKTISSIGAEIKKTQVTGEKKPLGTVAELKERIEKREMQIEINSLSASDERKEKQEIKRLNDSLKLLQEFEVAETKIKELKETREELFKKTKDLDRDIDEISSTIFVSESLLRIKEVTGEMMKSENLKKKVITIPAERMGQICGKKANNLRKLEEEYGVAILVHNKENELIISGNEKSILSCESMVMDMVDETVKKIVVEDYLIYTLLYDKTKYRNRINEETHTYISVDPDTKEVTIHGGKQAVQRAERAVLALGKKFATVAITPFIRSCLINNKMEGFSKLQGSTTAYLSLGEKGLSISIYGMPEDVAASKKVVEEYVVNHVEEETVVECGRDFFFHSLDGKGAVLKDLMKESGAKFDLIKDSYSCKISGLHDVMEKGKECLAKAMKDFEMMCIVLPVNSAQLNIFLEKKAALRDEMEKQLSCRINISKENMNLTVIATAEKREEAKAAIEQKLASVCIKEVSIPSSLAGEFIGEKGSNIKKMRGDNVFIDCKDGKIIVSGTQDEVDKCMVLVDAWMKQHHFEEILCDTNTALTAVVGPKGTIKAELMKELGVSIFVEKEGQIHVVGDEEKCKAAVERINNLITVYKKENSTVTMSEDIMNNAKELRRDELEKKMKEFEVTSTRRKGKVLLNGKEEALEKASAYLEELKQKYADYVCEAIAIDEKNIGSLIGKKGENLHHIEEAYDVQVNTGDRQKKSITIWCKKEMVEKVKQGIDENLKERVIISKEIKSTVKQVAFLTEKRNEVLYQIQDETKAVIRVPYDLPSFGPATVTIRGNENQVELALPLVRDALQGLVHVVIRVLPAVLGDVLKHTSLQTQRLALESHCRIECSEEKGEVVVVGPKEGIMLVRQRFWEQLVEVDAAHYAMIPLEKNVSMASDEIMKRMKEYCAEKKATLSVNGVNVYVFCEEGVEEIRKKLEEICKEIEKENVLVEVEKEVIPYLIGSKGSRIKDIKKTSGAEIDIEEEKLIHIHGKEEAVEKAKEIVEKVVEEYNATHVTISVDPELMYAVSSYNAVSPIQHEFFVRIIARREENRLVVIGQEAKQVIDAVAAVNALIEKARLESSEDAPAPTFSRSRRENPAPVAAAPVDSKSVWEKLKNAPLLVPGMAKKPEKKGNASEVNRLLGLSGTAGNKDCYNSESGYTVMF